MASDNNYNAHLQIQTTMRQSQHKLVYYYLGLAVAAIGYSINKTMGLPLDCHHSIVGVAILCWCITTAAGLRFIGLYNIILGHNSDYFDVIRDVHHKHTPQEKEDARKQLESNASRISSKTINCHRWMQWSFYAGIIAFVAWHIYMMAFVYSVEG